MTRPRLPIVSVNLPLPPSVNAAFASAGGGSHRTRKTAAYRFWQQRVCDEQRGAEHPAQLAAGPYCLWIDLPAGMRGDTDNRTKLLADMVRQHEAGSGYRLCIVHDDRHMGAHHVEPGTVGLPVDRCIVTLVTAPAWRDYVALRLGF